MNSIVFKGLLLMIYLGPSISQASELSVTQVNESSSLPLYCHYCRCTLDDDGVWTECHSKGLYRPPRDLLRNTTELYLGKNRIPGVLYKVFKYMTKLRVLDLSENVIKFIEIGAFKDLVNLERLYLDGNLIKAYGEILEPGVFQGLGNLKLLTLHNCIYERFASQAISVPPTPFMDLVGLETLSVDGYRNSRFTEEFKALSNLTTLTMSGVHGKCSIKHLNRFSFTGVPHLRVLILEHCDIETVDTDTFYELTNLTVLDLSHNNNLGFKTLGNIYFQSTKLTILKLNSIHPSYRSGSEILRENMRNIRHTKTLEAIYMEGNGLEFIDYGVFDLLPRSVRYLSMRNNRLHFGIYVYEAVFNTNLLVFDAGLQHPAIPEDDAYLDMYKGFFSGGRRRRSEEFQTTRTYPSYIPPSEYYLASDFEELLRNIYARNEIRKKNYSDRHFSSAVGLLPNIVGSPGGDGHIETSSNSTLEDRRVRSVNAKGYTTIRKLICSGSMSGILMVDFNDTDNNITHIDFSKNFIQTIKANTFLGLDRLGYLNLSQNYMENVDSDGFVGLTSLHTLDLHDNLLGFKLSTEQGANLFSHLHNVVNLNLSFNRIISMNKHVFSHMTNLETLDLSFNHLRDFDVDVTGLERLRLLNMSYNRIKRIGSDMRRDLNKLGRNRGLKVDLSANNLICTCETLPFLTWLVSAPIQFVNKDQYYCTLNNGTVRYLNSSDEFLTLLEEECVSYFGVIISCTVAGSFVASLAVFFVLYRQRWRLLYLYYMAKAKLDVHGDMDEKDIRFKYDVFVSYGDGDRMFVIKEMLEHLETNAGVKLNIRDRDFDVGEAVAVNISRAVRTSKRTFLLLSRQFLKNKWCNFEMNMARMEAIHMKRKVVVLVFLERIPNDLLPLDVLDLLRECPSIQFPDNNFDRQVFWEKCKGIVHE